MLTIDDAEELSIATWNVFNRSPGQTVTDFSSLDITAYQELAPQHLQHLKGPLETCEDFIEKDQVTCLGLQSSLTQLSCKTITINQGRRISPSFLGRKMRWIEALEGLHLVYQWQGEPLSVLNLHLSCAVPVEARRAELKRLLAGVELAPRALVLGDFNSFETWWSWPLLAPFTGARRKRLGYSEVEDLSVWMQDRGFHRVPTSRPTYPRLKLTLDHIFYRGLTLVSHEVARDLRGSDHRSISAHFRA